MTLTLVSLTPHRNLYSTIIHSRVDISRVRIWFFNEFSRWISIFTHFSALPFITFILHVADATLLPTSPRVIKCDVWKDVMWWKLEPEWKKNWVESNTKSAFFIWLSPGILYILSEMGLGWWKNKFYGRFKKEYNITCKKSINPISGSIWSRNNANMCKCVMWWVCF